MVGRGNPAQTPPYTKVKGIRVQRSISESARVAAMKLCRISSHAVTPQFNGSYLTAAITIALRKNWCKNDVSACIAVWSLSHWDTLWHRTKAGDMTPSHQLLPELCQWSHSSTFRGSLVPWGIKQWLPPVINHVSDGLLGSYCKWSQCFQETYCFDLLSCFVCVCASV